jgi:cytoskeletal protein CcmA (bactofilin family)
MWRKTTEAKPSPLASKTPAPAPIQPKIEPEPIAAQVSAPPAATPAVPPATEIASTIIEKPETATAPAPAPPIAAAPVAPAVAPTAASSEPSKITSGLRINGEVTGTSDLYVDGDIQGKVRFVSSNVTVGPNGHVKADIEAREITVQGTVAGNLKASERVRLGNSCRVQGVLTAPRVVIDEGAKFRGKVEMTRAGEGRSAAAAAGAESQPLRPVSASAASE